MSICRTPAMDTILDFALETVLGLIRGHVSSELSNDVELEELHSAVTSELQKQEEALTALREVDLKTAIRYLKLAMMGGTSKAEVQIRKEDYSKAEERAVAAFSLVPTAMQVSIILYTVVCICNIHDFLFILKMKVCISHSFCHRRSAEHLHSCFEYKIYLVQDDGYNMSNDFFWHAESGGHKGCHNCRFLPWSWLKRARRFIDRDEKRTASFAPTPTGQEGEESVAKRKS